MPEEISKITIIADLLKRNPAYKEVVDQLEERLYNRYMVYLADKPRFNAKTQAIPKQYLAQILSFKNTVELNKIAKKYNLSQEQRDIVPSILWKIFWREAEIKNLPQMLNSELGLENIRVAYQAALDITPIYMPISDYLGDLGMVMKRWQYELPVETQISAEMTRIIAEKLTPISQSTPTSNIQHPISAPTPPPIPHSSGIVQGANAPIFPKSEGQPLQTTSPVPPESAYVPHGSATEKDEPIAKVQETMARISGQMAKMQTPSVIPSTDEESQRSFVPQDDKKHSDIEPEYLPDEKTVHSANVIDLKNF